MGGLQAAWRGSYDAAVVALVQGVLWVAVFFVPRGAVLFGVPGLNDVIFVVAGTLLGLWLGFRLWVLARLDSGPSALFLSAFIASLLYVAYSLVTDGQLPQGSPDTFALAIRWIGAGVGALAILRWRRLPAWLGWIYAAIPLLEFIEVLAQSYTGTVLVTVVYALNTITAFGLGFALLRDPMSTGTESRVHRTMAST